MEEDATRGVEVTVGEARVEDPPSSGDTRVAEEATVVEDAAMVDVDANVVEVDDANVAEADKALVTAAMAGLLVLFGRRDSLSLSIFFLHKYKKVFLKQKNIWFPSNTLRTEC